jgi:nucleoside-diphosphate-sugar epimerase
VTGSKISLRASRVLVTGGAGLIGSFLVDELVARGASVIVVDDFSKGFETHLAAHAGRVEIRRGNLEDDTFAEAALDGADIVFHLASRAYGVGFSSSHHFEMLEHNERINNSVLSALYRHRPKHLLVTSSSCVHRDDGPDTVPELPLWDGEPEVVNWGYGWAKRFLEQKAAIWSRETGVPLTIVRPFNIYGERYRWVGARSQAIPMLVKRVLDGENPVVIWGSGKQRRNYLHARDCAFIMAELVARGWVDGPVNIGTEDTVTMRELVETICRLAGLRPELRTDTSKPEGRFVKSSDSTRLLAAIPDFAPAVTLDEGLGRMIAWCRGPLGPAAETA